MLLGALAESKKAADEAQAARDKMEVERDELAAEKAAADEHVDRLMGALKKVIANLKEEKARTNELSAQLAQVGTCTAVSTVAAS